MVQSFFFGMSLADVYLKWKLVHCAVSEIESISKHGGCHLNGFTTIFYILILINNQNCYLFNDDESETGWVRCDE